MPLSDRRLSTATPDAGAEPRRRGARSEAAEGGSRGAGERVMAAGRRGTPRGEESGEGAGDTASTPPGGDVKSKPAANVGIEAAAEAAGEADAKDTAEAVAKRRTKASSETGAKGSAEAATKPAAQAASKPALKTADKLAKLGLTRDIDLVLHLPMRYEDETSLTPIGHLLPGGIAQTEGVVFDNEIAYRPRRQLLVKLHDDAGDELVLRFLNFYGSQVKQMAIGARLRVRGDVRGGFFGMEMVHPAVRAVEADTPLPQALTPVYPSTAGVSQAYLRKAIDNALARTSLPELLPAPVARAFLDPLGVPGLMDAVRTLHHPGAQSDETALIDGTHPAWVRIKFEELLAQQMSLKRAHDERRTRAAPAMPRRKLGD
ncbi:ATP-dependent DNA helicase RecG, partial [Paraburkholderia sp. Ac-20336]|nr:ATP-dependent DNA helicase RecG [Paraburkholderia sp. Ac-20336]